MRIRNPVPEEGMEFIVVFSSTERFRTEFREFSSIFVPRYRIQSSFSSAEWFGTEFWEFSVPRNSRNSAGTSQMFRLFCLPQNNFLSKIANPTEDVNRDCTCIPVQYLLYWSVVWPVLAEGGGQHLRLVLYPLPVWQAVSQKCKLLKKLPPPDPLVRGTDPDQAPRLRLRIRILSFSHESVQRTEIMLEKQNFNTKF